ncbi:hypothetical protein Bbelb_266370 [Branchiostoma belcheri]|nr:hypothetical protein Bbelb_266370 [Branchiostoma belcheri]
MTFGVSPDDIWTNCQVFLFPRRASGNDRPAGLMCFRNRRSGRVNLWFVGRNSRVSGGCLRFEPPSPRALTASILGVTDKLYGIWNRRGLNPTILLLDSGLGASDREPADTTENGTHAGYLDAELQSTLVFGGWFWMCDGLRGLSTVARVCRLIVTGHICTWLPQVTVSALPVHRDGGGTPGFTDSTRDDLSLTFRGRDLHLQTCLPDRPDT